MVASLDVAATVPARPLATIEPNQSQATIMKMLLEAGVHFGHQTKRWNPKMRPYIFTERNGIHIIDLAQTVSGLEAATMFVEELAAQGGRMLFVGTKKQAQDVISEESVRCGQFYVNRRWPGGLLTNFVTIRTRLRYLADLEAQKARGEFEMRTKKEASKLNEEIRKLTEVLGGIKIMQDLPSAMFVVDPHKERIAMLEAIRLEIPILAIGDTNANPDEIDYVIPGNDDAIRSIKIITARLADAFIEGVNRREATRAEQMMSDEEQNRGRGGRDGGRGGRDGGGRDGGRDRDRNGRDSGQRRNDNAPQASSGDATANQGGGERRPQGERQPRPQGERQPRPQAQTGEQSGTATQSSEPRRERQPRPQAPAGDATTTTQGGGERPQGEPRRERQPRPQIPAAGEAPTLQTGEQTTPTSERTERPRRERSTAPRPTNAPASTPAPTDSESGSGSES